MLRVIPPHGVYIVRHRADGMPISYSECMANGRVKHFVVGIPTLNLTQKVVKAMEEQPSLRLYYRGACDELLGHEARECKLVIADRQALLHVPKRCQELTEENLEKKKHRGSDDMFYMTIMSSNDLFRLPCDRGLSLVMPYEVLCDAASELVLLSTVVEARGGAPNGACGSCQLRSANSDGGGTTSATSGPLQLQCNTCRARGRKVW
jgi:hypothetical protein